MQTCGYQSNIKKPVLRRESQVVPNELVDTIILSLDDPKEQLRVAVGLQRLHLYRYIIPNIPHLSMDECSKKGRLDILDWWNKSSVPKLYSHVTMDLAQSSLVLNWWKSSGLPLKYKSPLKRFGVDKEIVQWWQYFSGLPVSWGYSCRYLESLYNINEMQRCISL